jgi:hypothetical protein
MAKPHDITGQRFGRLVALRMERSDGARPRWRCLCDCGNEKAIRLHELRSGDTRSCGCLYRETIGNRARRHGGRKTRLYGVWHSMRARCSYPKHPYWDRYGGRGIMVCHAWADFAVFQSWALANGYAFGLTIDRIDNDGNYEPGNCRWATQKEQGQNTSTCHKITFRGETRTIAQWAEKIGLPHMTLYCRLFESRWSVERALTTPRRSCSPNQTNVPRYRERTA